MRISAVNTNTGFKGLSYGDLSKGRKEFEKLSDTEKVVKLATEEFRQNFNAHNFEFKLSALEGDLNDYVRFRISISRVMKKALAKFRINK